MRLGAGGSRPHSFGRFHTVEVGMCASYWHKHPKHLLRYFSSYSLLKIVVALLTLLAATFGLDVRHVPAQSTSFKATVVYGQPNFVSNDVNHGAAVDANGLNFPLGLTVDSNGGLFIADRNNNRVLHFPVGSTRPDRVYGQGGSFTSNVKNNDGKGGSGVPSADNLNMP